MADIRQHFSVKDSAKLAGLSVSMVDYLCRMELVIPTGNSVRQRGVRRRYTFGDVMVLRAIASLLTVGVSPAKLKKSLADLRARHREFTPTAVPAEFLVTDGSQVFLKSRSEVLETLDGSGQLAFAFVVDVEKLRRDVLEAGRLAS